ncbi:MAG: hypothetical protein K9J06_13395 [Flavobacteriales bacterium]|nr:hypothetical protein [Flavobacteriales bacterium]
MEYVIKLDDKKLYDALIGFLQSLGANVKGTVVREKPKKAGAARFKGILTESEAARFDEHLSKARNEWQRDT